MTQLISISLSPEAAELVEKLRACSINIRSVSLRVYFASAPPHVFSIISSFVGI